MQARRERVERLLRQVVKGDQRITPDKHLRDDLGLVSLQMMELIALVEQEFDVIIPVNKVLHIQTVNDLYLAIDRLEDYV